MLVWRAVRPLMAGQAPGEAAPVKGHEATIETFAQTEYEAETQAKEALDAYFGMSDWIFIRIQADALRTVGGTVLGWEVVATGCSI